MLHRK